MLWAGDNVRFPIHSKTMQHRLNVLLMLKCVLRKFRMLELSNYLYIDSSIFW